MGILDAPGLSRATADKAYGQRQVAITTNNYGTCSNGNTMTAGPYTCRRLHQVGVSASELRVVYSNVYVVNTTDNDNANTLTIKAALEIGGVIYPLTFGGQKQATIDGGGLLISDPLHVEVAKGATIYSRTYSSGTVIYPNATFQAATGYGGRVAGDSTYSGTIADGITYGYCPAAIIGAPTAPAKSVLIVGDSIADGVQDLSNNPRVGTNAGGVGGGFIQKALNGQTGVVAIASSGERGDLFNLPAGHFRRLAFAKYATTAICDYGRNDITAALSLVTVQANALTTWGLLRQRGLQVWQTTITPYTTSTDSWATTANQTIGSTVQDAVRTAFNDWLRGGAPVASAANLTAVTVGTSGALLAGQPGHPLAGYFEVADQVESARNSGIWKANFTPDGLHPNGNGTTAARAGIDVTKIQAV